MAIIEYNGSVVATVEGGNIATLPVKDLKMKSDIVITVPEGEGGDTRDYCILAGTVSLSNVSMLSIRAYLSSENYATAHYLGQSQCWLKVPKGDKVKITFCEQYINDEHYVKINGTALTLTQQEEDEFNASDNFYYYDTEEFEVAEDILDLEIYAYKSMDSGGSN